MVMQNNEPMTPVTEPLPAQETVAPAVQDTSAQDVIDRAADQAQEVVVPSTTEPTVEPTVPAEIPAPAAEPKPEGHMSMRERMATAESVEKLDELVTLGASDQYRFASNKTRNRWAAAAKLRRAELKGA